MVSVIQGLSWNKLLPGVTVTGICFIYILRFHCSFVDYNIWVNLIILCSTNTLPRD